MKGYSSREAPPPAEAPKEITVIPGHLRLSKAIETVKIANTFLAFREEQGLEDTRMVHVSGFGVNFAVYNTKTNEVTGFAEVGEIESKLKELQASSLPVVYPALPFLHVPTLIMVKHPVMLVAKFADCYAYTMVTKPGGDGFAWRMASIPEGATIPQLVIEIPSSKFRIVSEEH